GERLPRSCVAVSCQEQLSCTVSIGLHRGTLYAFRSFLYGRDAWIASQLQSASAKLLQSHENGIFVTGAVRSALSGTPSHNRFQPVRLQPLPRALAGIEVYRLCNKASDKRGRPSRGGQASQKTGPSRNLRNTRWNVAVQQHTSAHLDVIEIAASPATRDLK